MRSIDLQYFNVLIYYYPYDLASFYITLLDSKQEQKLTKGK